MNKKVLAGIAGAVIVAVGAVSLAFGAGTSAASGKYTYETTAVTKGDVARVISASGAVQPREKVEVGSEVSGRITAIYVDFNDAVKKDQVIAQVDPETFQNTLDQNLARLRQSEASVDNSRAAIDRAQVALVVAEKNFNRQKALFDQQAISQQAWELAEQTYTNAKLTLQSEQVSLKSALAGLETAKATVSDSRTRLERTKIRSPIDGAVLSRDVEVGQTIQSSQSIKSLFIVAADLSQIEIQAAVVESDIGGIGSGDPVVFTVDAFPGERFQGSVVQVRQLGAEAANVVTYTVVVNARNPGGRLLPGMTANVEITADRVTDVLRIASDATRFQPPKEILDAMRAETRDGQGGPGGGPGFGGQGGQNGPQIAGAGEGERRQGGGRGFRPQGQLTEVLKTAGVETERAEKIMAEMQGEIQKAMASVPRPAQQPAAGGIVGGPGFAPTPGMLEQQAGQERRAKMQQTQEAVLRRNLNEQEYAAVSKAMGEMQTQKRVTVYRVGENGELERQQFTLGLSDGSNAQIIRGAKEGDTFVVRANAGEKRS